ncbi:hypothetical protein SB30_280043 [Klebsiella quasipneumoniae subsp. similipneumoniae]|nr:hypothetical protein SB30_280043 [Klebsiella quasipneumoniae subsp. similipneumoniae]
MKATNKGSETIKIFSGVARDKHRLVSQEPITIPAE